MLSIPFGFMKEKKYVVVQPDGSLINHFDIYVNDNYEGNSDNNSSFRLYNYNLGDKISIKSTESSVVNVNNIKLPITFEYVSKILHKKRIVCSTLSTLLYNLDLNAKLALLSTLDISEIELSTIRPSYTNKSKVKKTNDRINILLTLTDKNLSTINIDNIHEYSPETFVLNNIQDNENKQDNIIDIINFYENNYNTMSSSLFANNIIGSLDDETIEIDIPGIGNIDVPEENFGYGYTS